MKKELALSFPLAIAVVVGALWTLDRFWQSESQQTQNIVASPVQGTSSQRPRQSSQLPSPAQEPRTIAQEEQPSPGQVVKCVLNGKTIYSDEKCPAGAKAQSVQLHHTAGVVSPDKAELDRLTAKRIAAENAQVQSQPQPVLMPTQSQYDECDALKKRITWLDSMARQPQSGQMQDWIRQERRKATDRQFAVQC